ncbi:exonuclease domain-containing protein [Asticcacaulis sp. AC402]|uniref:exonuclease domain-containing protein n=1 Tax=Asticcacaulis sp. AC402 TaxID=1282361 RepID=UPI0003C3FC05|nr:exonuclease domain-containing protein [Asticcacaulis sp. AC402]ESQ74885.1 hypothetical protein ABAC402_12080 [Asticcacaulis sp. AC402]
MGVFIVDVESDGPAAGIYSMVSIGIVKLDRELKTTFMGHFSPISERWIPEALAVSGISREQHLAYPAAETGTREMIAFLKDNSNDRPVLVSDNPAFDFQWPNYYCALIGEKNPFGHSGRRIGDLYAGLKGNWSAASDWKQFRKTAHTHDPVDDAMGNAEALIHLADTFRLKIKGL